MNYSTQLLRQLRLTIGQNIERHRMKQHIPLETFAQLTGIRPHKLSYYEQGRHEIRLDDLLKIACALGVEVTLLMG